VNKSISSLAKLNLISRTKNASYDGYRLTYGGLDYLALHTLLKNGILYSIGNQIGVGKESDIYVAASPAGRKLVVKIHRLGRISFRTVKANRDYLRKRHSGSWMHMSRLAALKEHTFMRSLRDNGFPVPEPIAWNRHMVVMEMIDGFPMRMVESVPEPAKLYAELIELMLRLAKHGLIHGDYNEFNILLEEKERNAVLTASDSSPEVDQKDATDASQSPRNVTVDPVIIDFPQMVSVSHPNAQFYFDRDVACIRRYFERRYHFLSDEPGPYFADATKKFDTRLDVEVEASGFSKKMAKELDTYMKEVGVDGDANGQDATADEYDEEELEEDNIDEGVAEPDAEHTDTLAVQSTEPDVVNGLTVLKLSEDTLSQAFPSSASAADGASLISGAKPRTNTAKAARGWVI